MMNPKNIAGQMGAMAPQPTKMRRMSATNPMEKILQRVAGRSQGRAMDGIKFDMKSLMTGGKFNG